MEGSALWLNSFRLDRDVTDTTPAEVSRLKSKQAPLKEAQCWRWEISKKLKLLLLLFALAFLAAECTAFVMNLKAERRAMALFQDVRSLRVGESTDEEAQQIVHHYGGEAGLQPSGFCQSPDNSHSVEIRNEGLNWLGEKAAWLRPFGNRLWSISVTMVMSHGRVCWVSSWVRAYAWKAPEEIEGESNSVLAYPGEQAYRVSAGDQRNIRLISVQVSTAATAEQMRHASDFDLSCLAGCGCRATCELLPSAWFDYQTEAREKGWSLPPEEANDPRCKAP